MKRFAIVAEQAARAGGRVLLELLGRAQVREKGPKDLVTEADTTSQRVIRDIVGTAFPEHEFVGEEDGREVAWHGEVSFDDSSPPDGSLPLRWIVDPLDGTANYVHGLPGFAVSVGLECGGKLLAGAVYDPRLDECFVALRGGGAFLNGRRLQVSGCRQLPQAMIAVSFPPNVSLSSPDIPRFHKLLVASHSLRRLGSAALNLSYVAAGRLDAYFSTSCKVWDIAAGLLFVAEAGGLVTAVDGGAIQLSRPQFAVSATRELHTQFLAALVVD